MSNTTTPDGNTPLKFSERHDRDWRAEHEGAWRRGHETAAIYNGDSSRLENPYPVRSGNWYAFTDGWNAWVLQALKSEEAS